LSNYDQLIKSRKFSLPGKKALSSAEREWSAIIVDVLKDDAKLVVYHTASHMGESPIERPKKNSAVITVERKKGIL
jgi:hypothetical protein